MGKKILKILGIIILVFAVLYGLLNAFAPFLIRRISMPDVKTEPAKYMKLEALPRNGVVLFVTAHPDDFEWWNAGTVPKLLERGNKVYLTVLTNGGKQKYTPRFYSKRIIKKRREEQIELAKLQKLTGWFLLDYSDGSLKYSKSTHNDVNKIVNEIGATDIFTFEPSSNAGRFDADHIAAGKTGTEVAKDNDKIQSLYYFTSRDPNVVIDITDTFDRKIEILKMWTEFKYRYNAIEDIQERIYGNAGKRIGVKYAESFKKIRLREEQAQQALETDDNEVRR